jgi:hypothetical protein
MSTREKISLMMKEALKNKDMERVAAIRLITAAMKDKDIASRTEGRNDGIDESALMSMLQSMVKQRKESAQIFRDNGRPELAEKEEKEIAVIEEFLPSQMSDDEAARVIEKIIASTGAASVKDMGKVMAELKANFAGQLDMAKAGGVIKQKLSG